MFMVSLGNITVAFSIKCKDRSIVGIGVEETTVGIGLMIDSVVVMLVIVEKVETTAAPAMTETITMSPIVAKSAKLLDILL